MKSLHNLFDREIDDLYSSALELLKILKRMSSVATNPDVVELFDTYFSQTQYQRKMLEENFDRFAESGHSKECKIAQKIRDYGMAAMRYKGSSEIRDVVLLLAVNMIKHFEKTLYGTLLTHARRIKRDDLIDLLLSLKKKIAEDGTKPLEIARALLTGAKKSAVREETAVLLAALIKTHIEEEKKLLSFLPKLSQEVNSEKLKEAVVTYQNAHQSSLKLLVSTLGSLNTGNEIPEWDIIKAFISETEEYLAAFGSEILKDIAAIFSLQRIQHQYMAMLEFEKLLSEFSGHPKMQNQFQTMLSLETGYDVSLTAIAEGSFFTEGLDAKAKP